MKRRVPIRRKLDSAFSMRTWVRVRLRVSVRVPMRQELDSAFSMRTSSVRNIALLPRRSGERSET